VDTQARAQHAQRSFLNEREKIPVDRPRGLHQFPSVKREFAIAVLDTAYETVAADANIA
jgi:hypothetical protein